MQISVSRSGFTRCPRHEDEKPSLKIYPGQRRSHCVGTFYCFGCGEGGDAITFYAWMKGISNEEAFKELARPGDQVSSNLEIEIKRAKRRRAFEQTIYDIRLNIIKNWQDARRLMMLAEKAVADFSGAPEYFWSFAAEEARLRTIVDMLDELSDDEVWRWRTGCKTWDT
jgi:DNA primase